MWWTVRPHPAPTKGTTLPLLRRERSSRPRDHRSSRSARSVVLLTGAVLAAGALSAVVAAPASAQPLAPTVPAVASIPTPPAPVWGPCTNPTLSSRGAECSFVTVPKDYADRSAGTIKLAISRKSHTTANYQGVMLVNPGGPGGSGLIYSILQPFVPGGAGQSYDWIGFDPRGVGSSVPAIRCDPSLLGFNRPDYRAVTLGLQRTWLARSEAYSKACAANTDLRLLRNMTTVDNARDMESIRLALGQSQINYYGFSYGTYLGQVYATLYPSKLRRAVFDSNVDPTRVFYGSNLDQDQYFQTTTEKFFEWVAEYDSVYHLGTTGAAVSAFYYGTLDALSRTPQAGGRFGPDEWNDVVTPAGYYQLTWLDVADVMAAAAQGNYAPALAAYGTPDASKDNGFGAYNATQCTDARWPTSYTNQWKPDALSYDAKYPFLTWSNVWYNAPCLTWPAPQKNPVAVDGSAAPPVLLIGEELDAATPFSGSLTVRQLFPSSSLVGSPGGTSHAVSLNGVACVDNTIATYLRNGSLPTRVAGNRADKNCKPAPEPVPAGAAGKTATPGTAGLPVGAPGVAARLTPAA